MKIKNNKMITGVVALLSLLVMATALYLGNPGVTVVSGCILFVVIIIYINRFISNCEDFITRNDD